MNITFEHPTTADAAAMLTARVNAFHDDARIYPGVEMGGPPGYDSLDSMLEDIEVYLCHKIVADGQVVGGIVLFDRGGGHFHLDQIYVDPAYHNLGIGTKAMQFLEKTYRAAMWTLDTPLYATRNHHFYEKLGYVRVGEKTEPDGFQLVCYEKKTGA